MQIETENGYFQYVILAVVVALGLLGVLIAVWAIMNMNFVTLPDWRAYEG
jgi:hypothetical protein